MNKSLPELIDRRELAALIGVSTHTIRMYERRGFIRPIYFSKRTLRYSRDDVLNLIHKLGGRR